MKNKDKLPPPNKREVWEIMQVCSDWVSCNECMMAR